MGRWVEKLLERASSVRERVGCRLGHHPTIIWRKTSPEFARPTVWEGECQHCLKNFRREVEEEAMIPESERIQVPCDQDLDRDEHNG